MIIEFQTGQETIHKGPGNPSALALATAFIERLLDDYADIENIDRDEAERLGELAAEEAINAARWSQIIGDRIDTTAVTDLLGITRQALAKRQASGSLLGIPGRSTTWYPTWQFDRHRRQIRPEVRDVIRAFRNVLGNDVDPLHVAAWALTVQHEDLEGQTPANWLAEKRDTDQLRQAARRTAERLAQ